MIKQIGKQINLNAVSAVSVPSEAGETEVPINYMTAAIQPNGKFSINQSIQNEALYLANMDEAKSDYDIFYGEVIKLANRETEN